VGALRLECLEHLRIIQHMASTLCISTDLETPARLLVDSLCAEEKDFDPLLPAQIIVPNAGVKAWLHLHLARAQGVAINLRIQYLESALWNIFQELSEDAAAPLEELEQERYCLLILSVLLDENAGGKDLKPIRDYLQKPDLNARQYCRRLWDTASSMARLIRDYEYHRQDEFIINWLDNKPALSGASDELRAWERCERALFLLVAKPGGLRDILSAAENKSFKTLPQFANEVIGRGWPNKPPATLQGRPLHLFGLSQISTYHVRVLRWLGRHLDVRLYHTNPLAPRVAAAFSSTGGNARDALQKVSADFQAPVNQTQQASAVEVLQAWAPAAAATLWRMSALLETSPNQAPFRLELPTCEPKKSVPVPAAKTTLLQRAQADLLAASSPEDAPRLPQDNSLQVVACPGVLREVETVHQSIIHHLKNDSSLRMTDIAVLVTDMSVYRSAIHSVFDAGMLDLNSKKAVPPPVAYSLGDNNAGAVSALGQALLGMLDMGLRAFTRSHVMAVLQNPCFLEKFNIDREQAAVWLGWAERLCVYHGWDRADKNEAGYGDSRFYTWKLALQRLRLGRIMESPDASQETPAPGWEKVIPYADVETSDGESLNAFCSALEQLLPRLIEFRSQPASGGAWAARLRGLLDDFLAIPAEQPGEAQVRAALVQAFAQLRLLDSLTPNHAPQPLTLTLALVREIMQSHLEGLESRASAYRSGGVTISALQPAQPIPYKIIYVLGLGEGLFPGSDSPSPLDLREAKPMPGDIKKPDAQRLQFLEALLAAREKLCLVYTSKDIQKDQELHPCSLVLKLIKYLEARVLDSGFKKCEAPLNPHDARYFDNKKENDAACGGVLANYSHVDQLLALREQPAKPEDAKQADAIGQSLRARLTRFDANASEAAAPVVRAGLEDLRRFLNNPADAALKHHLRMWDEDEREAPDDEPFFTDQTQSKHLVQETLKREATRAARAKQPPGQTGDWSGEFERVYKDRMQKGEAPDADFAQADLNRFKRLLKTRIGGLQSAFEPLQNAEFFGPARIGPSRAPRPAALAFPPLRIPLAAGGPEALLNGSCDLIWRGADAIHIALILHNCDGKKAPEDRLSSHLFDPLLFYLALLAGTDAGADGKSSAQWVGHRALHLTLALEDGFSQFNHRIEPDAARAYLEKLTAEFLDPQCFETIPFHTIAKDKELRRAFELPDGDPDLPAVEADYAESLKDALLEADENAFRKDDTLRMIDLVGTNIPADVFKKVRRRFQLPEQWPARNRQAEAEKKKESPNNSKRKK
jgi:exonuclease V gamma subunit